MKTMADYAVPTKANTKLPEWWEQLNVELARLGQPEATFGDVRGYYECGYCPGTAAADLVVVRGED